MEKIVKENGFPRPRLVYNKGSISKIWRASRRGIYVLGFSNGDCYVGQSLDVTKRFTQHRKTWDDIEKICFKRVAKKNLNQTEENLIKLFEREGYILRNNTHTTAGNIPIGMSDFDLIMSPEDQEKWRRDIEWSPSGAPRVINDKQRLKYTKKFQQFRDMDRSEEIIKVLKKYITKTIPSYRSGEMSYWSCTCLPQAPAKNNITCSRIHINWQSTFEVHMFLGKPEFSFYVAKSVLEKDSKIKKLLHKPKWAFRGAWSNNHQKKPGGQDQENFSVYGCEDMLALINNKEMLKAMRLFNLRLIRRGLCNASRFHCFDLADKLLEQPLN